MQPASSLLRVAQIRHDGVTEVRHEGTGTSLRRKRAGATERPNAERVFGRDRGSERGRERGPGAGAPSPDSDGRSAGVGAVKVASRPFPSLRFGDSPAVRRGRSAEVRGRGWRGQAAGALNGTSGVSRPPISSPVGAPGDRRAARRRSGTRSPATRTRPAPRNAASTRSQRSRAR